MVFIKNENNKIKGINWVELLALLVLLYLVIVKGINLVFYILTKINS